MKIGTAQRRYGRFNPLIVPVKNAFDEGLLRQWCRLRWKKSIDGVTDATILAEVERTITTAVFLTSTRRWPKTSAWT